MAKHVPKIEKGDLCKIVEIGPDDAYHYLRAGFIGHTVEVIEKRLSHDNGFISCLVMFLKPVIVQKTQIKDRGDLSTFAHVKLKKLKQLKKR